MITSLTEDNMKMRWQKLWHHSWWLLTMLKPQKYSQAPESGIPVNKYCLFSKLFRESLLLRCYIAKIIFPSAVQSCNNSSFTMLIFPLVPVGSKIDRNQKMYFKSVLFPRGILFLKTTKLWRWCWVADCNLLTWLWDL